MSELLHTGWILTWLPAMLLAVVFLFVLRRKHELEHFAANVQERAEAKERGSHHARLQHPNIDLSQCIGCGSCVAACPEDGVLGLMYGQAVVMHGARCVGHGRCAEACPAGAIAITLGDLSKRSDLPAVKEDFEAVGVPGLYLAGELTGFALVRTAVTQGVAVANAVARHTGEHQPPTPGATASPTAVLDLLVVGAGPAGVACSLRAKELGLNFLMIDQEDRVGGTVASYPRKKMVMTQPVDLPLHGRMPQLSYQKEELVELWNNLTTANNLPVRTGVRLAALSKNGTGVFHVNTSAGVIDAKNVCLALGRRGTPRKLEIPGEDLPKVAYNVLDVESYQDRRILVVGGGDSAIEAAVGLSRQPGNLVTISYRKHAFFRLKARNEAAIQAALSEKRLECLYDSEPVEITADAVRLRIQTDAGKSEVTLPNDDVFIFAGGIPPFALLEQAGVSFDPNDRPVASAEVVKGNTLIMGLGLALACALAMLAWTRWFGSYYELSPELRPGSSLHEALRPASPFGLAFGILACLLFAGNLLYLTRRSLRWGAYLPGTLSKWMGFHVFSGIFALLCVLIHSGFTFRATAGGHALLSLVVVVIAGAIGRYLYAFVPRAVNGAEANIDDLRAQMASLSAEWDRHGRSFGLEARRQIDQLASASRWQSNVFSRIYALFAGQVRLRRLLHDLREEAKKQSVSEEDARHFLQLARTSYRLNLQAMHFEDVRAILATWRYYHRWLAVLMILLAAIHVYTAIKYGALSWGVAAAQGVAP